MSPLLIGSIGVGLLLLGFVLNLTRVLTERSVLYLLLNVVGSFLAAWYAYTGNSVPFVILELTWGGAALFRLAMVAMKNPRPQAGG